MSALLFLFPYDLHIGEMLVLNVSNQVYLLVIRSIQIYYNNIYYPIIYMIIFIVYIIIIFNTINGTIYKNKNSPIYKKTKGIVKDYLSFMLFSQKSRRAFSIKALILILLSMQ